MSAKAFDAAFNGSLSKLKASLKSGQVNAYHKERGTTLLYTAARFGHANIVKHLVVHGADVDLANTEEGSKSTPLHGAAYGGHPDIIEYLLDQGAEMQENLYGDLPSNDAENPHEDVSSKDKKKCIAMFAKWEKEQKKKKTKAVKKKVVEEEEEESEEEPPPKKASKEKKKPAAKKAKKVEKEEDEDEEEETPPKKATKGKKKKEDEDEEDEPPKKKTKKEDNDDEVAKLKKAAFKLMPIEKDCEEFWDLEEKFNAHLQGRNDDYNKSRVKAGKKPLTFILVGAEKVKNPVLEERFEKMKKHMKEKYPKEKERWRERVSFHGSNPKNIPSILRTSLLRFKHPLNPCKTSTDDGWFGTNKKGVYVSKYADYTFKYSNDCTALEAEERAKTIMFKTLPGKSKHIAAVKSGLQPTPGYDSHSSPNYLEWYLFEEGQLCPDYVLEVEAKEDTRTAADDGDEGSGSD